MLFQETKKRKITMMKMEAVSRMIVKSSPRNNNKKSLRCIRFQKSILNLNGRKRTASKLR
jgi:hypothetical protein